MFQRGGRLPVRAQTHWLSVKTAIAAKPADCMSGTMCSVQAALPHTSARGSAAAIRQTRDHFSLYASSII